MMRSEEIDSEAGRGPRLTAHTTPAQDPSKDDELDYYRTLVQTTLTGHTKQIGTEAGIGRVRSQIGEGSIWESM